MTADPTHSETRVLKAPPLLLGAVLLFWGWQSGLPSIGAGMGIILEIAWLFKVRWDFSDTDFRRLLTFCTLFAFAAMLYVFTANQEAGGGFQGSAATVGRVMEMSSLRTSTRFFQWLPMFLFLFVAAQTYCTREKIPLTAISIISRWRSRRPQRECLLSVFHCVPVCCGHPSQQWGNIVLLGAMRFGFLGVVAVSRASFWGSDMASISGGGSCLELFRTTGHRRTGEIRRWLR